MGDPLVAPALVGFGVNLLLTEVIKAGRMAYRCKDECNELVAKLESVRPLVEQVNDNSSKGNEACTLWLSGFQSLLERAKVVTNECKLESRWSRRKRMVKFWRWKKLPSLVMKISSDIEEARSNTSLVTLGIVLSMHIPKQVEAFSFVKQGTPSLIVGVDEHFKKLKMSILQSHGGDKASHFGLQGRGGAGKTLLVQMLNNDDDIQMKYGKDSVIWMTVGLDAKVSDLYEKLGRCCILDNRVSEKFKLIKNQEEQRTFLKNAYAKKKVFLILDDVWEKPKYDHHDMLFWVDIARGQGSATLITSRSKSVLCKVQAKVEVVLSLPKEESWKLFCCHAFESGGALLTTLEELAWDVCEECKGLPLALKVIGSAMADKATVAEWRCALHDLRRSKPIVDSNVDDELFGRLELSYKELKDDATRICFLYFAAFPEDYEIEADELLRMWVAEKLFGLDLSTEEAKDKARAHLEILVRRSLIDRYQGSNYFHIHDVLRDLALHIIGKAERGECGYECFFQSRKEFAIIPKTELLKDLKRMSFMGCNICKWPEDLQAPHLKVCILREISDIQSELMTSLFKMMLDLKFLDLLGNHLSDGKVPCFGSLVSLTHLELGRNSFHEFPMSVVHLYKLVSLNVADCGSLKALPKSMGNLNSLVELDLGGCESLEALPESMGNLNSLLKLDLNVCRSLKALPESMSNLNSLVKLNLYECGSLKTLPESMGNWNSLVELFLYGCGFLKALPESMGNLKSLVQLNLIGCGSLEALPESMGNLNSLVELDLGECRSLKALPESMGNLNSLVQLNLSRCGSLKAFPESMGNLNSLVQLDLEGCESLEALPESMGNLNSLVGLYVIECRSLKALPESMGNLNSLVQLNLSRCGSLKALPESMGNLNSLVKLNLIGCGSLKALLESMGNLNSLVELDLGECGSLKALPESMGNLNSLVQLNLSKCGSLKALPESMGNLNSLVELDLGGCESLEALPESMSNLNSLVKLYLYGCGSLKALPKSMGNLNSLKVLNLIGCGSLKTLPESMGNLNSLVELYLGECGSLKVLPESMGNLNFLKKLNLYGCGSLEALPKSMGNLNSLVELDLRGCKTLEALPESIGNLKNLKVFK